MKKPWRPLGEKITKFQALEFQGLSPRASLAGIGTFENAFTILGEFCSDMNLPSYVKYALQYTWSTLPLRVTPDPFEPPPETLQPTFLSSQRMALAIHFGTLFCETTSAVFIPKPFTYRQNRPWCEATESRCLPRRTFS